MNKNKLLKRIKIVALILGVPISLLGLIMAAGFLKFTVLQDDMFYSSVLPQEELKYFEGRWIQWGNGYPGLIGNFVLNKDGSASFENEKDGKATTWEIQDENKLVIHTADGNKKIYTYQITVNKIFLDAEDGVSYGYGKDKWFPKWYKTEWLPRFDDVSTTKMILQHLMLVGFVLLLLSPACFMFILFVVFMMRIIRRWNHQKMAILGPKS